MAIPRVFLSSTFYDLRYIRENLKFFIKNMGFEPVLSESGGVFFDPTMDVQDACLEEVGSCQLFVLIIGGRRGSEFRKDTGSVVNHEYRKAVELRIPVFVLVEQQVYSENRVYQKNKGRFSTVEYPSVDSTKVFDFLEEVQSHAVNNALVPFRDYAEMEAYLKQQWAGMMHSFLVRQAETTRVANMLGSLTIMSEKIEFLSKQILASVGTDVARLTVRVYDLMLSHRSVQDLIEMGVRVNPSDVIKHAALADFLEENYIEVGPEDDEVGSYLFPAGGSGPAKIAFLRMTDDEDDYERLRVDVLDMINQDYGGNVQGFLASLSPEDFANGSSTMPSRL